MSASSPATAFGRSLYAADLYAADFTGGADVLIRGLEPMAGLAVASCPRTRRA